MSSVGILVKFDFSAGHKAKALLREFALYAVLSNFKSDGCSYEANVLSEKIPYLKEAAAEQGLTVDTNLPRLS